MRSIPVPRERTFSRENQRPFPSLQWICSVLRLAAAVYLCVRCLQSRTGHAAAELRVHRHGTCGVCDRCAKLVSSLSRWMDHVWIPDGRCAFHAGLRMFGRSVGSASPLCVSRGFRSSRVSPKTQGHEAGRWAIDAQDRRLDRLPDGSVGVTSRQYNSVHEARILGLSVCMVCMQSRRSVPPSQICMLGIAEAGSVPAESGYDFSQ